MMIKSIAAVMAGLALLWTADRACAQGILWNESVNGPLSNFSEIPTSIGSLHTNENFIFGASELIGAIRYVDYFTFTVPSEFQVTALSLESTLPLWIWFGSSGFDEQFGFASNPANGSLLPQLGLVAMQPGAYGMYVGNDSGMVSVAHYTLNFVVQPVPEPGTLCLFALGAGGLAVRRFRRLS